MEFELLVKRLEVAWEWEKTQIAKELLALKRAASDEIAEIQALWWHLLNLCSWLSEERDKIDKILRWIK